jgi:hypothetical protein
MTFFYDLNKKLDEIRATPSTTHGQLNERDMSRAAKGYEKYGKEGMEALAKAGREGKDLDKVRAKYDKYDDKTVDEGMDQLVQRIGGIARKAKKISGNVLNKIGHGDDAEMMRDLQKKMGLPQTGLKPGAEPNPKIVKEKMSPAKAKSFAALAEPKDKITFADKIAGAKKEVDEMLGDVAAEAMKNALSGGQKKLDKNNNGKLDANDFAMLRKGAGKKETDEGSTGDYSAKKARAGKDIGKPGKGFAKIAKGAAERYGSEESGKRVAGAVLNKLRHKNEGEMDEGWDDMVKDVHSRAGQMKTGEKIQGHKGEIEKTATGIRHTRRYDDKTGVTDTGDETSADGEKRGRGRPKKAGGPAQERVTAKSRKADRTTFQSKKKTNEGDNESDDVKQAMALLKKAGYKVSKAADGAEELDEKAVSKKQQRFMGMVHATQKGEKAPSKEVAKVAKSMGKKDAEDFASTKHKGLPEKKKEKEVEESSTTAGSVATSTSKGSAKGMTFGKGIYDSFNRDLESMISESMSVNMSNSTEGGKSLTITASDEDAVKLATLLKSAGLGGGSEEGYGGSGYKSACGCGTPDCSCGDSEVDEAYGDTQPTENQPNWPTNQEGAQDNFEYSGGLNKPKSTGQTTVPVIAGQEDRDGTYAEAEEDAIKRMMEMAGIKTEAKKVDEDDVEEGNKFTGNLAKARAAGKTEADLDGDGKMEKVDEGILSATANLWSEYKGKYGV